MQSGISSTAKYCMAWEQIFTSDARRHADASAPIGSSAWMDRMNVCDVDSCMSVLGKSRGLRVVVLSDKPGCRGRVLSFGRPCDTGCRVALQRPWTRVVFATACHGSATVWRRSEYVTHGKDVSVSRSASFFSYSKTPWVSACCMCTCVFLPVSTAPWTRRVFSLSTLILM